MIDNETGVLSEAYGCMTVTLNPRLSAESINEFASEFLVNLNKTPVDAILFDVSGITVMDLQDFDALKSLALASRMMGSRVAFIGFRPELSSALTMLGIELPNIKTFQTSEEAIAFFKVEGR